MRSSLGRELSALFLFSAAILSLELSFTKFFSVVQWYHFGFLVISTAMLGFAVAGVYLAYRPTVQDRTPARLMALSAVVTMAAYLLMTRVAAASEALFASRLTQIARISEIAAMAVLLFVPFFLLGLTVSHLITIRRDRAGIYYGANLLGSAAGAFLFLLLFETFSGDIGVPLNAAVMFTAAAVAAGTPKGRTLSVAGATVVILLAAVPGLFPLDPPRDKILGFIRDLPTATAYTGWSSLSKVDFVRDPDTTIGEGSGLWGISDRFRGEGRPWPERMGIIIDSWAYTTMVGYPQDLLFYDYMPTTFVYALRRYDSSLHIGAGGGLDLLAAHHYGVRSVQGVEINRVIVKAVAERFGDYSGGIYAGGIPGIEVFVDEGRHFIERSARTWDLIQLSGVDTYSSTQAGAFALSENNLYTVEALKGYYAKLNDGGLLTMTRWFAPDETGTFRYELRLLDLARQALEEAGAGTDGNIFYFISKNYTVLTVKKGRFSDEEAAAGYAFITRNEFIPLIVPGMHFERAATFERFLRADRDTFDALVAAYPYDVSPPTDDRPFYFEMRRFSTLFSGRNSIIAPYSQLSGQSILAALLVEVLLLGLAFVLLPLWLLARRRVVRPPITGMFYFSLIGAAFMLVEIVLSQRFVLYLGHPVYALSVVLFSILLFSGIGSAASQYLSDRLQRWLILLAPVLMTGAVLASRPVLSATLHHSFPVRVLLSLLFSAALSLFMGMFFPAGVRRADEREVPVYWGVNGLFSVIASVSAVLVSINLGFTTTLTLALCLYAAASLCFMLKWKDGAPGR